jgi:DNA invertase Pin-like site-specific DNA recombinase
MSIGIPPKLIARANGRGLRRPRAEDRYAGRKPTIDASAVTALREEGLGASEIARRLGIGRASIYRLI